MVSAAPPFVGIMSFPCSQGHSALWSGPGGHYVMAVAFTIVSRKTMDGSDFSSSPPPERPTPAPGLAPHKLHEALRLIESSMHVQLKVADISAAALLSAFHFSRQFTKSTGMSPHAYLTARRVEKAKELLTQTDLPIAQIALRVGYRTQAHLTGVFVKAVGMTPRRYRLAHTQPATN
jgi:transcriptional regulator GlxA family with amidase domain